VRHGVHQEQFFRCRRHAGEYSKAAANQLPRLAWQQKNLGRPGYFLIPSGP
jgi:hypothetical protein